LDFLFETAGFSALLGRFTLNLLVAIAITVLYYRFSKNKEYLFTFIAFNILIFLLVYLMNSVEIGIGFGFGLFGIISILRYRTETIRIKEMTYLFIVIIIAVLNSIVSDQIGLPELLFSNGVLILMTWVLEMVSRLQKKKTYRIVYEKIENIRRENKEHLLHDLRERTGLDIYDVSIENIDFLKDVANLRIYFTEEENSISSGGGFTENYE